MKGLVNVARRELVERKMVLYLGLAFGVLPLVVLPIVHPSAEARAVTTLLLLGAFAWGTALVLGGSIYATDLAERRLGFFFARPLSPAAIVGGKLAAAAALVIAGSALVVVPAVLLGDLSGRAVALNTSAVNMWLLLVGLGLLLIPIAHGIATVVRTRDPWSGIHVPLSVLLAAIVAWSGATITRAAIGPTAIVYIFSFALLVPLALAGAAFVQGAAGRTDPLRSHRALAATAWASLFVMAVLGALGSVWYAHPSPSSIARLWNAHASPDSRFTFVAGEGTGIRRGAGWGFLLDVQHPERFLRTGAMVGYWNSGAFSHDGSTAAWLAPDRAGEKVWTIEPRTCSLRVAHLGETGITVEDTGLTMPINAPGDVALSPKGTRVGVVQGSTISVFDIVTRRTLVAAKASGTRGSLTPVFTDEDHLLVTESWGIGDKQVTTRELAIFALDVPAKRLVRTGSISLGPTNWGFTLRDPSGDRLLAFSHDLPVSLRDGRTGALIADFGERGGNGTFLADGRILLVTGKEDRRTLRVFGRSGAPIRAIELGGATSVQIAGQPTANTVTLGLKTAKAQKSVVVDLESGSVVRELAGLAPLGAVGWLARVAPALPPRPVALFSAGEKSLVTVDVTTGAKTQLFPR